MSLVEQHLDRPLTEDGRWPVTMSTYRFSANKLNKFIGGLRVGEASPDPASTRHFGPCAPPTVLRWPGQSKSILRGCSPARGDGQRARQRIPVRDVQPVRSKRQT